MTEIDPELRSMIVETHTDMRWVREQLDGGKETFKEHDKRIRELEQNQSRIMGVVVAVGSVITIILNILFHFWDKIRWK